MRYSKFHSNGLVHTIDVLQSIVSSNPITHLQLMLYLHRPFTLKDGARHYVWVESTNLQAMVKTIESVGERVARHLRWGLAFTSRAKTQSGEILHIPMIDFRAKVHSNGEVLVKKSIFSVISNARSGKALPGYLLVSGESYHYIGMNLLTPKEWSEFLGMCLLCEDGSDPHRSSPVDRRWIGRTLTRDCGSLRVFASDTKPEPFVVDYFEATEKGT